MNKGELIWTTLSICFTLRFQKFICKSLSGHLDSFGRPGFWPQLCLWFKGHFLPPWPREVFTTYSQVPSSSYSFWFYDSSSTPLMLSTQPGHRAVACACYRSPTSWYREKSQGELGDSNTGKEPVSFYMSYWRQIYPCLHIMYTIFNITIPTLRPLNSSYT